MERCACRRGRRRCLLPPHNGAVVPHRVHATDAEATSDGFYYWNTGPIYQKKWNIPRR